MDTAFLSKPPSLRKLVFPYGFLVFVPVSLWFFISGASPGLVAVATVLALIPVTSLIARSTHELSARTGTAVGSLLNVTFGNAIELAIAIFAIRAGLVGMVQASISGSIVINILLLIGLSMLFGGMKHREQVFNKDSAGVASTMLLIAVAGLALPSLYSLVTGQSAHFMSQVVSVTLAATYLLSLFFTLFTHRHLFVAKRAAAEELPVWSAWHASLVLAAGVGLAALEANVLVETVRPLTETWGLSELFIGLVLIAIVTNIPEHIAAITFGLRDNITLSLEIGMNSAIQIALFVAPVLVFVSPLVSGQPFTLAFTPFEMVALILTVMIINYLSSDGICNWLEGVQLVAVYLIIASAFFVL